MSLWQLLSIIGIIFLILEIFTPSMFFLNFSLAAFLTAAISLFTTNISFLSVSFVILSLVSFLFLRPIIVSTIYKTKETGINNKYIDKIVTTDTEITESSGVINIYGERWDARNIENSIIPAGSRIKIIKNDSIILYVKKIDE